MDSWHRIAFSQARVIALAFTTAGRHIGDALRKANYPPDIGIFYTDDWVHPRAGDELSLLIYFSPKAAEMFASLIQQYGGPDCLKPLPFGLAQYGNDTAGQ